VTSVALLQLQVLHGPKRDNGTMINDRLEDEAHAELSFMRHVYVAEIIQYRNGTIKLT